MKPLTSILLLVIGLVSVTEVKSQGCSDAGVCSVNSMVPGLKTDSAIQINNAINSGVIFGMSQHDVLAFTSFIEYTRSFGDHFALSGKFNYGFRSGELADVNGPADLLLSLGYTFLDHFTITGGVKIPMNNANNQHKEKSLPMNYQVSLGTTDILLGFGYNIRRFSFVAGYQQPVTQNNNQFLATDYPEGSPESKYFSTRNYERAADVMLRLSYIAVQSNKINLLTSLLPIYHLQEDSYQEPDSERVKISGSQGLTLNINVIMKIHLSEIQDLEFNVGAPAVARDIRPDGLSKFAIGIGYKMSF